MENLSFEAKEDLVMTMRKIEDVQNLSLCLVGRFLTERAIYVPIMKERMAEVWQPLRGVSIRDMGVITFLFQFSHL